ncbi:hypothetical protein L596_026713 [Steinernema carpocapsae]|uniref:Uncharacterized protein n=1 Tax=Steinernema carpocapsae TaxID=34508 RepID=A0A4U5M265_STECR|nr:hypothetical protein L596_026713 [Steinernema carpocapsae]
MFTPRAGYKSIPGKFASMNNMSKPLSWLAVFSTTVIYLMWVKKGFVHMKDLKQERQILINVLVHFGVDMAVTITYQIIGPTGNLVRIFMETSYLTCQCCHRFFIGRWAEY